MRDWEGKRGSGSRVVEKMPFHELAHSCFLSLVSGIIPPSNPPTCQVELEDPGKAYEAVIRSVGSKFKAYSMDYHVRK